MPADIVPGSRTATNPRVSPDGEMVVFDSLGDVTENISVFRSDGSGMKQLTHDSYRNRAPFWSPDGRQIVFFSDGTGRYQGWIMDADGGNLRQVTSFGWRLRSSGDAGIWATRGLGGAGTRRREG